MQQYEFLPETSPEFRAKLINTIGSWQLEGLEPSPELILNLQLVQLGKMSYEDVFSSISNIVSIRRAS